VDVGILPNHLNLVSIKHDVSLPFGSYIKRFLMYNYIHSIKGNCSL
jgi:hypothetical protein